MAATLTAALRNPAGDWVFVTTSDGASGWTPVTGLVAFGLDQLPVLDVNGETSSAAGAATGAATDAAAGTTETVTETMPITGTEAVTETAAASTAATPESAVESAAPIQGVPALVTITEQRLNIRSGPSSEYRILGKAQPGEELTATARTPDSQWVQVARADLRDGVGWVAAVHLAAPAKHGATQQHSISRFAFRCDRHHIVSLCASSLASALRSCRRRFDSIARSGLLTDRRNYLPRRHPPRLDRSGRHSAHHFGIDRLYQFSEQVFIKK